MCFYLNNISGIVFMISIVLPTYNREATLLAAIMSVVCQTYFVNNEWELIVVDDCSTDETSMILNQLSAKFENIVLARNDTKCGANFSRNLGVSIAKGDIVFFQDSDDIWFPNKVEKQVAPFSDFRVDAVFSSFIKEAGGYKIYPAYLKFGAGVVEKSNNKYFMKKNPVSTQCLAIRKSAFEKLGGFDNCLPRFQDWDFAIRMIEELNVFYIDSPLVLVCDSIDSITKNFGSGIIARKILLDKHRRVFVDNSVYIYNVLNYFVRYFYGRFFQLFIK